MLKLNGWRRIGVIASVAWVLGAYSYVSGRDVSKETNSAASFDVSCEVTLPLRSGSQQRRAWNKECEKRADDILALETANDNTKEGEVALIPVPLGWGFAYLVLFLARWIRRGFIKERSRQA